MKTTKILFAIGLVSILSFTGCSPEEDIKNPDLTPFLLYEEFNSNTTDGVNLNLANWTNYAEAGTVKWREGIYYSDRYTEFTAYTPIDADKEPINIGWLISPAINMDQFANEKLAFNVAQAYVSTSANSLEVLISTDFNGTNVETANWDSKTFDLPPLDFDTKFDFFSSGAIDLSQYKGNIHIAFKVVGSGTDPNLDGTYEIDNVRIYNK